MVRRLRFVGALGALLLVLSACVTSNPVGAVPGGGSLLVKVEGLPSGTDGDVLVSGPDNYSHRVTETTTLSHLQAGTYTLTSFAASDATRGFEPSPGNATATVTVATGDTATFTYSAVVPDIPNTTKPLTSSTVQYLQSVTPASVTIDAVTGQAVPTSTGGTVVFSQDTPELQNVQVGDVVAFGPSPAAPYGFLGKVTSIGHSGNVTLTTAPTDLSAAIASGVVGKSFTLDSSNVQTASALATGVQPLGVRPSAQSSLQLCPDLSDVVLYENGPSKVAISGNLCFSVTADFTAHFHLAAPPDLSFAVTLAEDADITAKATASVDLVDISVPIATYTFGAIVVPVGPVPVVMVPTVTLYAKADGSITATLEAGVHQGLSFTRGMRYSHDAWSVIAPDAVEDFSPIGPNGTANVSITAKAGPEVALNLYGVAGPTLSAYGYLDFEASVTPSPQWALYGGVDISGGVQFDVLHRIHAEYTYTFLGFRKRLAGGDLPAPEGTASVAVTDAVTQAAVSNIGVQACPDGAGCTTATVTEDPAGTYAVTLPVGSYSLLLRKSGYLDARIDNVDIAENDTTYLQQILYIDQTYDTPAGAGGQITDALTGGGVAGAQLDLRAGINATSGTVIATATTDSTGLYTFSGLDAGYYTAAISKAGYSGASFTLTVVGGQANDQQNASISPDLQSGEWRVVLTWGASPSDLDSHLTGPLADGSGGRFHVFYGAPTYAYNGTTYAQLDHDDTSSYGPETITLYQQTGGAGVYRYSVHDYSYACANPNSALGNSGAQVKVYAGNTLVRTFNVPSQPGTLWTVFELDFTKSDPVVPVNDMSYECSSSAVQGLDLTDGPLIRQNPAKGIR